MPRQTREQIDAEIVDRACGLFAAHGLRHTSLQQVADDVGYSKAGLLHHFPSKEAIAQAAIRTASEMTTTLVEGVARIPAGVERDRALVEALVDNAFQWPGTAAFLNSVVSAEPTSVPQELIQAGLDLLDVFGISVGNADDARLVQVLSACAGLQACAETAVRTGRTRELRSHITTTAMVTLGHQPHAEWRN